MTKLPGVAINEKGAGDEEALRPARESLDRPLVLISAIFVGLAITLIVVLLLGFGLSEVDDPASKFVLANAHILQLIYQSLIDGHWQRMALVCSNIAIHAVLY